MKAWVKRFGLHLAAAIGATGIFVGAAAVGATQTRQQVASVASISSPAVLRSRTPLVERTPSVVVATPTASASSGAATGSTKVAPERSLAGTIREVLPDEIVVLGVGGREWHVAPAPGAMIRLNGRAAKLDGLVAGDKVVILGQAQAGRGSRFLAHAITARQT